MSEENEIEVGEEEVLPREESSSKIKCTIEAKCVDCYDGDCTCN